MVISQHAAQYANTGGKGGLSKSSLNNRLMVGVRSSTGSMGKPTPAGKGLGKQARTGGDRSGKHDALEWSPIANQLPRTA
eukprot:15460624-Alexandrium_andersonii.AAC.1